MTGFLNFSRFVNGNYQTAQRNGQEEMKSRKLRREMKHTLTLITLIPFYFSYLSVIHILRCHHLLYIHRKELMRKLSNLIFLVRFDLICQNLSPFNVSSSLGCFLLRT